MLLMPVGQACLGNIVNTTVFMCFVVSCVNVISSIVGQCLSVMTANLVCVGLAHVPVPLFLHVLLARTCLATC